MTIPHAAELAILPVVTAGALVALSFTPTDISTLTIALATLCGALFSGVSLLITTITRARVEKSVAQLDENTALTKTVGVKVDTVIEKAVEIHTLTNSNLSKVTESLNVALEKISGLEQMVIAMTEAKRVADQLAKRHPNGSPAGQPHVSSSNIQKIEANTKETAENTARTDTTIKKIKKQE